MKQQITIPVFLPHRGCPHKCIFCDQKSQTGTDSFLPASQIREKVITYRTSSPDVPHVEIAFFGGSFTALPEETQNEYLSEAQKLKSEKLIHEVRLSTRPDCITPSISERLADYGVNTVELGAQSFDETVLEKSNRGHTVEDIYRAVEILRNAKIQIVLQLLPGLPGETYESRIHSAQCAAALSISGARIYPAVVFKGTVLADLYLSGKYTPLSLDEAVESAARMITIFSAKNIPVLRTGIHPLDASGREAVIAGPYHPAFGSLCKSRVRRNELANLLRKEILESKSKIILEIPEICSGEYLGNKKENIDWLKNSFSLSNLEYRISKEIRCPTIRYTD